MNHGNSHAREKSDRTRLLNMVVSGNAPRNRTRALAHADDCMAPACPTVTPAGAPAATVAPAPLFTGRVVTSRPRVTLTPSGSGTSFGTPNCACPSSAVSSTSATSAEAPATRAALYGVPGRAGGVPATMSASVGPDVTARGRAAALLAATSAARTAAGADEAVARAVAPRLGGRNDGTGSGATGAGVPLLLARGAGVSTAPSPVPTVTLHRLPDGVVAASATEMSPVVADGAAVSTPTPAEGAATAVGVRRKRRARPAM